jgi:hypothetical protein
VHTTTEASLEGVPHPRTLRFRVEQVRIDSQRNGGVGVAYLAGDEDTSAPAAISIEAKQWRRSCIRSLGSPTLFSFAAPLSSPRLVTFPCRNGVPRAWRKRSHPRLRTAIASDAPGGSELGRGDEDLPLTAGRLRGRNEF